MYIVIQRIGLENGLEVGFALFQIKSTNQYKTYK